MKTLHEIVIKSNTNDEYKTTITLLTIEDIVFYVIVKTEHKGVIQEFEQRCDNYKKALQQFLEDISEYANHTAIMNL